MGLVDRLEGVGVQQLAGGVDAEGQGGFESLAVELPFGETFVALKHGDVGRGPVDGSVTGAAQVSIATRTWMDVNHKDE